MGIAGTGGLLVNIDARIAERFGLDEQAMQRLHGLLEAIEAAPMNLTAWRGDALWERGVWDSLLLLPWIDQFGTQFLDIGSGAGFPGMVLAIARTRSRWTLLESRARRAEFLQETAGRLGLDEVRVAAERAEEWIWQDALLREGFDAVTMRAVAGTRASLELGLPYVRTGGRLLLPKGSDGLADVQAEAEWMARLGGGRIEAADSIVAGPDGRPGKIVIVEKAAPTPEIYPRPAKQLGM